MKIQYNGPYMPVKQREGDAGYDIKSNENCLIYGKQSLLVQTGLKLAIPDGYVGILKSRSGLAVKHDLHVGAGVIDSNYRGEVGVLINNLGELPQTIEKGERIAQLLIIKAEEAAFEEGDLDETDRGADGYGSSGRI